MDEFIDRLFVTLFPTATALRAFLRDLPDGAELEASLAEGTSRVSLASAAASALVRRGAIDVGFFARLTRRFPGRRARIAETAGAFGIDGPVDVANFFQGRFQQEHAQYLDIDQPTDSHRYRRGWAISSQVESVLNFITELVLRDHLWVEQDHVDAWLSQNDGLDSLVHTTLVRPKRLSTDWPRFKQRRRHILDQICVTRSLREVQGRIQEDFAAGRKASDPMHSQVVYGTAGNLARSALIGVPHLPHPLRKHVLAQTSFAGRDAVAEVQGWIQRERAELFERTMPGGLLRVAHIKRAPSLQEYGQMCFDLCAQRYADQPELAQRLDTATSLGTLVFAPKGETILRRFLQKCGLTPRLEDEAVNGLRTSEPRL